ncbi:MAG: carbohydrate binding family 9 domain-containing protein [Bacteroidales bacterium]|nr:carbohydrate binding family 9 domain-containing protein [Bacteroidales bacterium]
MKKMLTFALFVALSVNFTVGQSVEKRTFSAFRSGQVAPVVDGDLSDVAWKDVPWIGGFTQQVPNEGQAPSKPTLAKIIFDHNYLYVAIFCYDDRDKIIRTFSQRDNFSGDCAGIALDSYNNKKTAYEFNLTAAGQKIDIMHSGDGNIDFNWNANWAGKTSVCDSGWSAEMAIPFSQLRYNRHEQHTWGLHIWRWLDRNKEENQWQLIPVNAPAGVHNFGVLEGISGIRESRQAELMPYALLKYSNNAANENPYIKNTQFSPNAGIDAKIGISSDFTLDVTINPDFGQVEADPAELNLTAYETFFEEKRPFFLEGNEIFDFNIEENSLFYSRRLGASPQYQPDIAGNEYLIQASNTAILGSAKLTGRTRDGLSVGILETVTGAAYSEVYSPRLPLPPSVDTVAVQKHLAEPLTNYFASRVKKESKSTNTIVGGTFNSVIRHNKTPEISSGLAQSAHTAGIDFQQYFYQKNYYMKASSMLSHIDGSAEAMLKKQLSHVHRFQRMGAKHVRVDSNLTAMTGSAGFFETGKRGGKYRFGANVSYWSPSFNINDIGYMPETDYIEQETWFSVNVNEPKNIIRAYNAEVFYTNRWSFGSEHSRNTLSGNSYMQLSNLWTLNFTFEKVLPYIDTRVLRGGPGLYFNGYQGGGISVQTNSSKRVFGTLEYYYYWNKSKSRYYNHIASITVIPLNKLKFSANAWYEIKNFNNEYFNADFEPTINRYYLAWLDQYTLGLTFRAEYYVTPEISVQYYGNPLYSIVDYSKYMRITNALEKNEKKRLLTLTEDELIFDDKLNRYFLFENGLPVSSFENPDVSFGEFRSNAVFKWEYKPGSVCFLVWSHQQGMFNNTNSPRMDKTFDGLMNARANDIFIAKFSYWFNL